ncbi:sensor domain-containing protein [Mycobacterium heidelbergense]|uniref:sensor domain-containing protein n=1 Tax=Mycobacterium heidelbergense TaxID=53376 RepID=UPI003CF6DF0F
MTQPVVKPPRRRAGAAASLAAVVSVSSGCTTITAGSPQRDPAPPPPLPVSALEQLMPSTSQLADIMEAPQFAVAGTSHEMEPVADDLLSDKSCYGAVFGALEPGYRDSGYTGIYEQRASDPGDINRRTSVAVVAFPGAPQATQHFQQEKTGWQACAGKTVTVKVTGQTVNWTLRPPEEVNGVAVELRLAEGQRGYGCSHALTAANNIIIDVVACSDDSTRLNEHAAAIVNAVRPKIPL